MPVLTIARLTLLEIARRRLLLAVFLLTALVVGLTGWGFSRVPQVVGCGPAPCSPAEVRFGLSVLLILVIYMFSFILALGAAFLAAPAIAAEAESGILLALLPRPIRRSDVVLGKWLGLVVVLLAYTALACGSEFLLVQLGTGYLPPHPVKAIAYLVGEGVVLLTLTLLGSTRLPPMTVGICALVLYGIVWLGGVAGAIGSALGKPTITHIGTAASLLLPTDGLWRGALFNLEPAAAIAALSATAQTATANAPFVVLAPPPTAYLLWALGWVALMLLLAVRSLEGRDL